MAEEKPKVTVVKKKKKKGLQVGPKGQAHILATYNNTMISLTDQTGNVITWSSAGKCGFKGPKKATAYAAQIIVRDACNRAAEKGLKEVTVFVRGIGTGREAAVRALNTSGLNILSIKDVTPLPHNGCRPKKIRRV
ncbi:MAG: 30S ribosomal protein S11 [Parcubacteria group bacterium]|nr:30S ribosomal protein S11 [Parcubacteria group bacterium]